MGLYSSKIESAYLAFPTFKEWLCSVPRDPMVSQGKLQPFSYLSLIHWSISIFFLMPCAFLSGHCKLYGKPT